MPQNTFPHCYHQPHSSPFPTDSISHTSLSYHSSPNKSTQPSTPPPPLTNNKALNKPLPLATKSISSTSPQPCTIYMQGHCRYGKGLGCSYPHPPMCLRSLRVVIKDVQKVTLASIHILKFATHPYYPIDVTVKCYLYNATGTIRHNLNQDMPRNTVTKRSASRPSPQMYMRLPPLSPPHSLATDTQKSLLSLTRPYNVAVSINTPDITYFLGQMKDMKFQILQMQQTQTFLLKNITSQGWPPYWPRK